MNINIAYLRKVQASIESGFDLGDLHTMWQRLFLDHVDENINLFLLVDGTHELDDEGVVGLSEIIRTLAEKSPSPGCVKLAVTFRPILKWKLNIPSALRDLIVNLQERSQTDIKSFIRLKANRLTMFAKDSKNVQDLKEEVCNGLFDAVDGNFALAALKLQEISTKYDRDEVLQLVRNVKGSASLKDSMADIIREYNRTLSTNEIHILNTLLVWTIYFRLTLNVEQLEAVLFVQHRKETLQLAQMIESKFSLILELTDKGRFSLKYNSIRDYFEYVTANSKANKATDSNHLTKGEIRIVRNFVHKLCEEETYHQLGLEEFFEQKISQAGTGIAVNCDDAHAQIALVYLRVMTEDWLGRADRLLHHAPFCLRCTWRESFQRS